MCISWRLNQFLLLSLACAFQVSAQQNSQPSRTEHIYLDVVVTPNSGAPVSGLTQQDLTVLDNGVPQTIRSFEAVDGHQAHMEVIVVLDVLSVGAREVAIAHEDVKRFLSANRGRLAFPTAVALLTEKGLQFQPDFSEDGNAISSAFGKRPIPLPSIGPDADRGGGLSLLRNKISLQAFAQILEDERGKPGRKIILWVSPGWSPNFGLEHKRDAELQQRLEEQVFGGIVDVSTELRDDRITLYSIDPRALADIEPGLIEGACHLRLYREPEVNWPSQPSEVRNGDLALDVLARQSGGLVLHPGADLAAALRSCLADAETYYEISFAVPSEGRPNEYHHLEVRVTRPGLTARTRRSYYAQPERTQTLTAATMPGWEGNEAPAQKTSEEGAPATTTEESAYANVQPYIDEPLAQLAERVPELKTVQPATDQDELPHIEHGP
jgi:VWFA-related protein